jgi:hypothetical protein
MITTAQDRVAALRRSLMRVKPEYFSWPIEEQESYRVAIPEDDWFRIRQTVLQTLAALGKQRGWAQNRR